MDALWTLAERVHSESSSGSIPISESRTRLMVGSLIASGRGCVLVSERDGRIDGVLVGVCDEMFFSDEKYAIALVTWAERVWDFCALVRRFVRWAMRIGVREIIMDASFGGAKGERGGGVLRALGFEVSGTSYVIRGQP
jgi:hypothetical protein